MTKKELWLRLKAYHFEHIVSPGLWGHITEVFGGVDASTKAFAAKIARKHQWRNNFALKAVSEYKKFVYLGIVSDFYVTPSKIIDVVWHEHLLFSKAYREFCNTVIEYTFDHNPELIAMTDQTGQFSAQYLDTLDLYKIEFGVDPPADIWDLTKYDKEKVNAAGYRSGEKKAGSDSFDSSNNYYSDGPLCTYFDSSAAGTESYSEFSGFDGGDGGGAGASGSWSDGNNSDSSSDSGGDSGGDGGGCSGGCGGGD